MTADVRLHWSVVQPGQHVADVFVWHSGHPIPQFRGKYRAIMAKRGLWTATYSGIDDMAATTLGHERTLREVRRLCEQHSARAARR